MFISNPSGHSPKGNLSERVVLPQAALANRPDIFVMYAPPLALPLLRELQSHRHCQRHLLFMSLRRLFR
jgi:hypothetical protein